MNPCIYAVLILSDDVLIVRNLIYLYDQTNLMSIGPHIIVTVEE